MKNKNDPNDCEVVDLKTGKCLFRGSFPDCWNHVKTGTDKIACLSHFSAEQHRSNLIKEEKFRQAVQKEIARVTAKPPKPVDKKP